MGSKKSLAIWLALVMLSANTGFAFSVHYCGGEIASVKPVFAIAEKSGCCGQDKPKMGCCKTRIVKQEKAHETIIKSFSFSIDAVVVPIAFPATFAGTEPVVIDQRVPSYCCDANAPPLFALYHQYLFYA